MVVTENIIALLSARTVWEGSELFLVENVSQRIFISLKSSTVHAQPTPNLPMELQDWANVCDLMAIAVFCRKQISASHCFNGFGKIV